MNSIRIQAANLGKAQTFARAMDLQIDEIYGDADKRFVNVAARHTGPRGNHEPRWTAGQREFFAGLGL